MFEREVLGDAGESLSTLHPLIHAVTSVLQPLAHERELAQERAEALLKRWRAGSDPAGCILFPPGIL